MTTPSQYRIVGSDLQFVEIILNPQEAIVGEPGAMMYMSDGIEMETMLGDGRRVGFLTRLLGAIKRLFTGESLFSTVFSNNTATPLRVAFASEYPGKIVAVDLAANGGSMIAQKGSYLCGTRGVQVGLAFKKRLRVGLFGGEGFVMQKLIGDGMVFINASGTVVETTLGPNSALKVDTGCLVALQSSATYDIRYVGKLKSALFGGEGMFFAYLKGPGKVWLQSLPMKRLSRGLVGHAMGGKRSGIGGRAIYFGLIILGVVIALLDK